MGLIRTEQLRVGAETDYRDGLGITDAAVINAENISFDPNANLRLIERPPVMGMYQPRGAYRGGRLPTISFSIEMPLPPAPGSVPSTTIDVLLKACHCAATVVPSTSVTYGTISAAGSGQGGSCTIEFLDADGREHLLKGCRGTATISAEVGGRMMLNFTFSGHWNGASATYVADPTPIPTAPAVLMTGTLNINSLPVPISAWTLDLGNEVVIGPDYNQPNGYGVVRIAGVRPVVTVDPEAGGTLSAALDAALDGGIGSIPLSFIFDSSSGNRMKFDTVSTASLLSAGMGERDGVRTRELEILCAPPVVSPETSAWTLAFSDTP